MLISYWRDNIPTLTKGNEDAILYSDSSCENPIHLLKLHLETFYLLSTFGNTSLSLNLQVSAHCSILNLLTTQCKKRVVWNAFYSAANLQAHIYNTSLTTLALFWRARLWKRCLPPPCTSLQFCFNLSSCSANQCFSISIHYILPDHPRKSKILKWSTVAGTAPLNTNMQYSLINKYLLTR